MTRFKNRKHALLIPFVLIAAIGMSAQVERLKDASNAKIPTGSVTGQIDGKTVAALQYGHLGTAGGLELGSPDLVFDHYKISLQDAEMFFDAKAFADITVTVRRGEQPDGKTFRRTPGPQVEQPGMRGEKYFVPEFLSLSMRSRTKSQREQKVGAFERETWLSNSIELSFTGRVEFDKRKGDRINARVYVCFADKSISCLAGTVELEIR